MQKALHLRKKEEEERIINDADVELYLLGRAKKSICNQIEKECLEWNSNTSFTMKDIARAKRVMKNVFESKRSSI